MPGRGEEIKIDLEPAIRDGIKRLDVAFPSLAYHPAVLRRHVDEKGLTNLANKLLLEGYKNGVPREELADYVGERISDEIASANYIKKDGLKYIFGHELENYHTRTLSDRLASGFRLFSGRRKGEDYLHETLGAFDDLAEVVKKYGADAVQYAPEFINAVGKANRIKLLAPSIEIFEANGWVDKSEARKLKEKMRDALETYKTEAMGAVKSYLTTTEKAQQVVSMIMFGVGLIMVLLYSLGITGNLILESATILTNSGFFLLGVLTWLISLVWMYVLARRRKTLLKEKEILKKKNKISKKE